MFQHDLECGHVHLLDLGLVPHHSQEELVVERGGQVEAEFRETVWSCLRLLLGGERDTIITTALESLHFDTHSTNS